MTPPLVTGPAGDCPCGCPLTPATSYGFEVITFADLVLGMPLDPWQELAAIHIGELLPDGRPRFRIVLILVARQNGKTLLAKVLMLYWLFVDHIPLTLLTSTDRGYAKRTYKQVVRDARNNGFLRRRLGPTAERKTIGEETFVTLIGADAAGEGGTELTFRANNGSAGRSMTLWRWLCDELREHRSRDAWDSATNAQNAVGHAQTVCISNQGDDSAVVLDSLHGPALRYIATGEGDPRVGLLEWSAPDGAAPDSLEALAAANPNMGIDGHGPDVDALVAAAGRAREAGGEELSGFVTEVLCRRVAKMDPAIDQTAWEAGGRGPDDGRVDLADHRDRVVLCLDVSLNADHAAVVAAAVIDGVVFLDVVAAWAGPGCTREAREALPGLVERVSPRAFGWFPSGPAAVVAADLAENRAAGWPPRRRHGDGRRVELAPITADMPAACMGLAALVLTGEVAHYHDPMLTAQAISAQRHYVGDRWVFGRKDGGPVNAAYAAAGATWLARTLPPPPAPLETA